MKSLEAEKTLVTREKISYLSLHWRFHHGIIAPSIKDTYQVLTDAEDPSLPMLCPGRLDSVRWNWVDTAWMASVVGRHRRRPQCSELATSLPVQ